MGTLGETHEDNWRVVLVRWTTRPPGRRDHPSSSWAAATTPLVTPTLSIEGGQRLLRRQPPSRPSKAELISQ